MPFLRVPNGQGKAGRPPVRLQPCALPLQECPGSSVPFRAVQCSLYDGKPILGSQARYQWVPFHGGESWIRIHPRGGTAILLPLRSQPGGPSPAALAERQGLLVSCPLNWNRSHPRLSPPAPNLCDLNCLAVGHNFYYTFGRVLDGTRCSPDSPDLCISGQCLVGLAWCCRAWGSWGAPDWDQHCLPVPGVPRQRGGFALCLVPKELPMPRQRGMLDKAHPPRRPCIQGT